MTFQQRPEGDKEEIRKQIMQILGQEQRVQRPWGRSLPRISDGQQRGQSGRSRGTEGEARWGRASWPTVVTAASVAEQGGNLTWFCSSRTREWRLVRGLCGDASDGWGLGAPGGTKRQGRPWGSGGKAAPPCLPLEGSPTAGGQMARQWPRVGRRGGQLAGLRPPG